MSTHRNAAPEPESESEPESASPPSARLRALARPLALVALLGGLWLLADATGMRDSMTEEGIRQMMDEAGPLGMLTYLGVFAIGQLAQLPGMAFVLAARVAYGPWVGFLLGYLGALVAVSVSFFVVRGVGGRALKRIKWKWAQKVLARLDERPVLTIALLRTFFILSPPLNYALAMSETRYRHYLAGSALGLVLPIGLFVAASDFVLSCT